MILDKVILILKLISSSDFSFPEHNRSSILNRVIFRTQFLDAQTLQRSPLTYPAEEQKKEYM